MKVSVDWYKSSGKWYAGCVLETDVNQHDVSSFVRDIYRKQKELSAGWENSGFYIVIKNYDQDGPFMDRMFSPERVRELLGVDIDYERELKELLCILHRDGGQTQGQLGMREAIDLAWSIASAAVQGQLVDAVTSQRNILKDKLVRLIGLVLHDNRVIPSEGLDAAFKKAVFHAEQSYACMAGQKYPKEEEE